jgi:hypothetical protein
VINNIQGRIEIFIFKWKKSKLTWVVLGCITAGLFLAFNGDYGYVPSEYCDIYPWLTYGIIIIPMLAWMVELELINRKYKNSLDEIRRKYGFKN